MVSYGSDSDDSIFPIFRLSDGQCVLRFSAIYNAESKPVESRQSLIQSITNGSLDAVQRVSNVSLIVNRLDDRPEAVDIEVGVDLPVNEITDEQEDQLVKAFGRALMNGGVQNPVLDTYSYSVVSR